MPEIPFERLKKITFFSIVSAFAAAMIHENAFLFMPLLYTFLGFLYYRQKKFGLWCVIAAFSLAVSMIFAGFCFSGTREIVLRMESSWRRYYHFYLAGEPAKYLYGERPLFFSFLLGKTAPQISFINIFQPLTVGAPAEFCRFLETRFFLYLLPLFVLSIFIAVLFLFFIFSRPFRSVHVLSDFPAFLVVLLVVSLLLPLLLFMTTDWGRWLSNIVFVWTVTACSLLRSSPGYKKDMRLDGCLEKSFFWSFVYLECIAVWASFAVLLCIEWAGPFLSFSFLPFCFFAVFVLLNRLWGLYLKIKLYICRI